MHIIQALSGSVLVRYPCGTCVASVLSLYAICFEFVEFVFLFYHSIALKCAYGLAVSWHRRRNGGRVPCTALVVVRNVATLAIWLLDSLYEPTVLNDRL